MLCLLYVRDYFLINKCLLAYLGGYEEKMMMCVLASTSCLAQETFEKESQALMMNDSTSGTPFPGSSYHPSPIWQFDLSS